MNKFVRCFLCLSILVGFALSAHADLVYGYMPIFKLDQFKNFPKDTRQISSKCNYNEGEDVILRFDDKGRLIAKETDGLDAGYGVIEYFIWENVDGVDRVKESTLESHGSDVSYSHGKTKYNYDADGRLVSKVTEYKESCPPDFMYKDSGSSVVKYLYNDAGQLVSIDTSDSDGNTYLRLDYEYLADGNISAATLTSDNNTKKQVYEYDKMGRRKRAILSNIGNTFSEISDYYGANEDNDGNVIFIVTKNNDESNNNFISAVTFSLDNTDCLLDKDPLNPNAPWNGGNESFASFLRQFCKDKKFRDSRSAGMVDSDSDVTLVSVCLDYPQKDNKGLAMSNAEAKQVFGPIVSSPEMLSEIYAFDSKSDIYCYGEFVELTKDSAVVDIYTLRDGVTTKNRYFFGRKNSEWHLLGRCPQPSDF